MIERSFEDRECFIDWNKWFEDKGLEVCIAEDLKCEQGICDHDESSTLERLYNKLDEGKLTEKDLDNGSDEYLDIHQLEFDGPLGECPKTSHSHLATRRTSCNYSW